MNMRLSYLQKILFGLLLSLLIGWPAAIEACPACNIYNYLAESVAQSTNIVIGKLVARESDSKVKIQVINTLRGPRRAGEYMVLNAWSRPEAVGQTYIFSDPWDNPSFPMLEMDCDAEVRALIRLVDLERKKPNRPARMHYGPGEGISEYAFLHYPVRDLAEAISLVQGWSNESLEVGLKYLHHCQPAPSPQLIAAITPLKDGLFSGKGRDSTQNRLGNLLTALLMATNQTTETFILEQTRACLIPTNQPVNWTQPRYAPSDKGELLAKLLGLSGTNWTHRSFAKAIPYRVPHVQLQTKQKQLLLEALPHLQGLQLADTVCAICETQSLPSDQLITLAKASKNHNEFALGVYWPARRQLGSRSIGNFEQAFHDLQLLAPFVTNPWLKKEYSETLEYAQKLKPALNKTPILNKGANNRKGVDKPKASDKNTAARGRS